MVIFDEKYFSLYIYLTFKGCILLYLTSYAEATRCNFKASGRFTSSIKMPTTFCCP